MLEQALSCYRRAAELDPDSGKILIEYARTLQLAGDVRQAIFVYARLIKCAPDTLPAYVELGGLLFSQGRFDEARDYYEQALRLKPDTINALLGLVGVWNALDRPDDAVACFTKAIALLPHSYQLHCDLGLMLESMGQIDEAGHACQQALALKQDYVPAMALQASIYRQQGRYLEAFDLIDSQIRQGARDSCLIQEYLNLCHKVDRCDEAVNLSMEVSAKGGISDQDLMCLYFSTGHALDRLGRYDEAFKQFTKANGLRGASMDIAGLQKVVDDMIIVIDSDPALLRQEYESREPKLIFIIGMPRSGTTLAEQILSSHPDVYGAGEITALRDVCHSVSSLVAVTADYPRCIRELDESGIEILRHAYLSRLPAAGRGAPVVIDKQLGNFLYIGLIRLLFPDAPIISCTRDPLDTCLSCYFNNFRTLPFTYDLVALGQTWRAYRKLMDHWHTLSIPMMEFRYETLVEDVEEMSRKLLAYCGLDWDESCLRFHENARIVATVSKDQVNQPIYRKSVGRWKNYEAHLEDLKRALQYPG